MDFSISVAVHMILALPLVLLGLDPWLEQPYSLHSCLARAPVFWIPFLELWVLGSQVPGRLPGTTAPSLGPHPTLHPEPLFCGLPATGAVPEWRLLGRGSVERPLFFSLLPPPMRTREDKYVHLLSS